MPYSQLTMNERHVIDRLHLRGFKQATIARATGRSPSTISRELQRNHGCHRCPPLGHMTGYIAGEADRKAHARRTAALARRVKIADNPLGDAVRAGLRQYWSPQQIAERLKLDHPNAPAPGTPGLRISHEAIYQWVYRQARRGEHWHRQLRRAHKRRRPRIPRRKQAQPRFAHAVSIDQRPPIANSRIRVGDWESDTVVGCRRSRAVLATHVERTSRYVLIRKLPNARAATFNHAMIDAFADVPPAHRLSMTCDNGSEFARPRRLQKKLGLQIYFAHPHSPWQRGTNENLNGLLRQFFPKGCDLRQVRHQQVAEVQRLLNNRPRKCLNYRTPAEVFFASPIVALRI